MSKRLAIFIFAILVLTISVVAQDAPPPPEIDGEIVVEGLNAPQGVFVDSEGTLWVTDSGSGGDETIEFVDTQTFEPVEAFYGETSNLYRVVDGEAEVVASLPSVAVGEDFLGLSRLAEIDGTVYATVGFWHMSNGEEVSIPHFAEIVSITDEGVSSIANMWSFEMENNPDETTNVESHPYGLGAGPDGWLYMTDAAGNFLARVNPETGETELVAVFDPLPGVFPSPWRNGELLADPVPTGVAFDDEGNIYVSLLSGAPFIPGSAKVVQVSADGEVSDFAPGLTMLTDLIMGPDGNLYATQFGLFTEQGPVPNSGAIVRILEDGTYEVVVDGLPFLTGIAMDEDGGAYVTINGVAIPNAGMVVYYEGLTDMEGMTMGAEG